VAAYNRSLQLTQNQYNAGVAAKSDVITAQSQVLSAQAQLIDTGVVRAQMEHAIAMLVGVTPADLAIAPAPLSRRVPVAPSDVASTLLQRRPDIAGAERRVKAANALIGVEEAAFYPTVTLSASYGYGATNLGDLFNASSSLWSLGSQLADTLIDAGARRAAVRAQRALADEQTAVYRQTVLAAFETVEDELVALRVLEKEYEVRVQAETAAKQVQQLALNEYKAGLVNYTTVVTDQALALTASQNVLTILQQRLQASVALVQALGGGWDVKELPKN
jgi:NodT family efflux transporter outer membrane factor (OMF) lipoprotein